VDGGTDGYEKLNLVGGDNNKPGHLVIHCVPKKLPTFKLSETLSTDF